MLVGLCAPKFFEERKIDFKKLRNYILAYLPWIGVAAVGIGFHASRVFYQNDVQIGFTVFNLIVHLNVALFVGLIYFMIQKNLEAEDKVLVYQVALFLLVSCFMINYERFIIPILPISIVFGLRGIELLYQNFNSPVLVILLCAGAINLESYGIYPYSDNHLDERDMIHKQEWDEVIDNLSSGNVATTNARDLLYYMDLEKDVDRSKEGPNEIFETDDRIFVQINDADDIEDLLDEYNITYIVFQKIDNDDKFIEYMSMHTTNYSLHKEFEYTIVYKRN